MKFGEIRKSLLIFCLTASIAVHIGAIWFLYAHPFKMVESDSLSMIAPPHEPKMIPKEDETLLVERMEQALEQSLNTVVAMSRAELHHDLAATDKEAEETFEVMRTSGPKHKFRSKPTLTKEDLMMMEVQNFEFAANMPPPFDPEMEADLSEFARDDELDNDPFASYESEKYASVDFTDPSLIAAPPSTADVIEDDYTMTDNQFSPSALPSTSAAELTPNFVASLKKLHTPTKENAEEMNEEKMFSRLPESTAPQLVLPNSVDYLRSQWIKRSLAERHLPELEHYGLDEIASNIEWEDDLEVNVTMMPDSAGGRYVFSLEIEPEFEAECQTMDQNFYFLLDRSSSVDRGKFNRFKRAVQRSMAALRDGDRFNVYIFDKKIEKLSDRTLPVTPKTIQMAEDFLERQSNKTHNAAGDVYTSLEKMLPERFDPDEMHSVILITDGNTILSPGKQKKTLASWAKRFDGNVNFYTAAAGKGNNLVLLDLLSYTTGGSLIYSDTNAAFPRKLVRLIRDLHNPIVKNVTIEVSGHDPGANVVLYPRQQLLPAMYARQAYTVVGTVDELCDLTLFIQGRNHDRWLNIRKQVSLKEAARGGRNLEKLWAHTQSKICYDHFLQNGRTTHLKEAQQIVAPYKGTISMD